MTLIDEKEYAYLLHLLDTPDKKSTREFVSHSRIYYHRKTTGPYGRQISLHYLTLHVDPEIFKKYHSVLKHLKAEVARYGEITDINIREVSAIPELDKFQIIQNEIVIVVTPWENINKLQAELIENLRKSESTIDYQNIGNRSRIILQQLAGIVFEPSKHVAEGIDLSEGKFKNRLHTYIKAELAGDQNDEFRDYINSIVASAEKAIDLSNKLTHDTKTKYFFAEACVIGVVTTIGLIKLVSVAQK